MIADYWAERAELAADVAAYADTRARETEAAWQAQVDRPAWARDREVAASLYRQLAVDRADAAAAADLAARWLHPQRRWLWHTAEWSPNTGLCLHWGLA